MKLIVVMFLILIHKLGITAVAKGMVDVIGMNENRTAGQIHGKLHDYIPWRVAKFLASNHELVRDYNQKITGCVFSRWQQMVELANY